MAWTSISAGIALVASLPLIAMLANPVSELVLVRGSEYHNNPQRAFIATLVLVAPATYALFFATAGELLKTRVSASVHRYTMRVAAGCLVPCAVMALIVTLWSSGPQDLFMAAGALTVPLGIASTIWASAQDR
jgi:hypothetical protein